MENNFWYDYNNIRSRNSMLNFILTNRGGGKTFGFKKLAINNFLKNGNQFIYVRRYKTEFKKIITFFDDIKSLYPEHTFKCDKNFAYIDNKVCGYFVPLSTANNEKSTAYPKVTIMAYDEFIIDKKNQRYLPDEPILMNGLIETVVRFRDDLTVFFLANNVTITNPYFEFWGIYPNFKQGIKTYNRGEKISVELNADESFIEEKIKTRWGKLINNTKYGKHSIYNETLTDDNSFLFNKRPQGAKFIFSLVYNGSEIGIWNNGDIFYCEKKIINTSPLRFVLQKDDLTPDFKIIDRMNTSPLIYTFKNSFKNGRVYFKDKYVKSIAYDIFKYIGIR